MPQDSTPVRDDRCSLPPADYQIRITRIRELNTSALVGYQRHGGRIELQYHPSAAANVREFIRRERKCCSFLRFDVDDGDGQLIVTINAPAELGPAADSLFDEVTP